MCHTQAPHGSAATAQRPTVRVAIGDYDHTRDLWNGHVAVPGCRLDCTVLARPEELFKRFLEGGEWDAAEMSLSTVAAMRAQGDDSLVVLPVFPARSFRHGAIYVRTDGPRSPEELNGACIGIPAWVQTAGVFVRGMLAAEHGVDLASVEWIQAGVDEPGRREPVDVDLSAFDIRSAPDATLDELLLDGHVDAVISARPPASVERRDPRVRRLLGNWAAAEMDYYRRTRIFPIMHTLVVRRAVHERDPRIAEGLIAAFTEAKDRSVRRARSITVPSYPLAWAPSTMLRTAEVLGDDLWPYGIESSGPTLDAFLDFCEEQSITPRRLSLDELFAR